MRSPSLDSNTLNLLEYDGVLQCLAALAHSEAGRLTALALKPDLEPKEVLESWNLIREGREILNQGEDLDLGEHLDLTALLEPLEIEGARLGAEELLAVGLEAAANSRTKSFLATRAELVPSLGALAAELVALPDLVEAIERTIGPEGEILSTASPELARLRLEQAATRQGISSKLTSLMHSDSYRSIVRDDLITTRSDRFVVPVRAGGAGKSRGLIHDWSKTGATAFLEPFELVDDNNKLGLLKRQEKAEIDRILARLSAQCQAVAPDLLASGAVLTHLDLIMAQARLARDWGAIAPNYLPGAGVSLHKARHPLLMERLAAQGGRMVPLDLELDPNEPLVIISGLNTGGKTVAMKTMGLNLLMARAGLHLPVGPDSTLDFLDVLAVMGDEQDLSADLSTFSGHIRSLNKVLNQAGPGMLVLLDEIGAGTDPAEGAALGLAILESLQKSGALLMAATHYQLIKTWAALTPGVVSAAVNSSEAGQALYGLSYGHPGFSGGLKMARRLGLPTDLVDQAEGYLDEGQKRAMELLAKLDEERSALELARLELEEERLSLARAEAALREQTRRQTDDWNKRAQAQDRAVNEALATTKREFEELKREMRAADAPKIQFHEKRAALEKNLRAVRPNLASSNSPLGEVKEGDLVLVGALKRTATVRTLNLEKGEAWVDMGGLNVKVATKDLFPPDPEAAAANKAPGKNRRQVAKVTVTPAESMGLELNLLGQTLDQALDKVAKELDRASLANQRTLYIVHGYGTGRLRQGIRNYLKNHPQVQSFERAPQQAGGDGVTVVTLA